MPQFIPDYLPNDPDITALKKIVPAAWERIRAYWSHAIDESNLNQQLAKFRGLFLSIAQRHESAAQSGRAWLQQEIDKILHAMILQDKTFDQLAARRISHMILRSAFDPAGEFTPGRETWPPHESEPEPKPEPRRETADEILDLYSSQKIDKDEMQRRMKDWYTRAQQG